MNAYIFPGQASQFPGMGKDLYEQNARVRDLFSEAVEILGFDIREIMFSGTEEQLKETRVTQPAVFLHSISAALHAEDFRPDMVAGHSLGEFSALVAAGALSFSEGMELVRIRASAMQEACELEESTMAAILGLSDGQVEDICRTLEFPVVPANYNCPGQLVISGSKEGIARAIDRCTAEGALKAIELKVGGAFHSPFMEPAREALAAAIERMPFQKPVCPVYQNVNARAQTDPAEIRRNLIDQLTAPVRWTQTMQNMISDGAKKFIEVGGNGKTLVTFVKRIDRSIPTEAI